jgi:hypothetical protein
LDSINSILVPSVNETIHVGDDIEVKWSGNSEPRRAVVSIIEPCSYAAKHSEHACTKRGCSLRLTIDSEDGKFRGHCLNNAIVKIIIHSSTHCINKVIIV